MTDMVTAAPPGIERDGWGRPKVIPLTGGKPVGYTRCTTYVGGIEDMFKLGQWQQRHVAVGIASNEDLLDAVRTSDLEDRRGLDVLVDEAKKRAGAGDKAAIGTYMHSVTEAADRGQDPMGVPMPWLSAPRDPLEFLPDLAAYLEATAPLKAVHVESFTVLDNLKIGGTPDRIVKVGNKKYIADLKTGSIDLGSLKIAAQLAVYSRSHLYDWKKAATLGSSATPDQAAALRKVPGVEMDRGIVVHLPAGTGECHLYWVDLEAGWDAVRTCRDIRRQRTVKFKDLMEPFKADPVPPRGPKLSLEDQLASAPDRVTLTRLWKEHASSWTDALTALSKQRLAQLGE